MTDTQAKAFRFNPFDLTKVWPQREYPPIEVGVMELNRYPDNYFAEVEQAAFSPANIVPGISRSEEHTSELQSLMRISYAVFCLKKKTQNNKHRIYNTMHTTHQKLKSHKYSEKK